MTADRPSVLAPAAKRARLISTFLKGRPVWCTWQVTPLRGGRPCFNVDHRGRVSKCLEFHGAEDEAGDLSKDGGAGVLERLRLCHAANRCQACWMSSRGEVEGLYTWRGFVGGLATLVRP